MSRLNEFDSIRHKHVFFLTIEWLSFHVDLNCNDIFIHRIFEQILSSYDRRFGQDLVLSYSNYVNRFYTRRGTPIVKNALLIMVTLSMVK